MPTISVVVPIYNVATYLKTCLNSIERQTWQDFELILVEDCSTDNTVDVLNHWLDGTSLKQIIYKQHEINQGLSVARNTGITAAKGKYLVFIDSDDYITATYLADLHDLIEAENADIVALNYRCVFESERTHHVVAHQDSEPLRLSGMEAIEQLLQHQLPNEQAWGKMFRTDFIKENKLAFQRNFIHEDLPFSIQAFALAHKVVQAPTYGYYYRIRDNSITGNISPKNIADRFHILDSLLRLGWLRNLPVFKSYCQQYLQSQLAYIYDCLSLTYAEFRRYIQQLEQGFAAAGVQPNKAVGMFLQLPYQVLFLIYRSGIFSSLNNLRLQRKSNVYESL